MNFQTKFKQISWKMKFAVVTSALWFLYWAFAGWVNEDFFWGLGTGGFPIIVLWGFWMIAIGPRKDKDSDLVEYIQINEFVKKQEERKCFRLEYPLLKRPSLKVGEHGLEIIDISERGLKLLNEKKIEFDRIINGEAVLLSGKTISVEGEVAWSLNNEIGLLTDSIPASIIAEEKRILSKA
jgi:hypothetical protein